MIQLSKRQGRRRQRRLRRISEGVPTVRLAGDSADGESLSSVGPDNRDNQIADEP